MRISRLAAAVAALAVGACGSDKVDDEPAPASLDQVLPNIPLPPDAEPVSTERSPDALKLVFTSARPADSVVAYYRGVLSAAPYRLINESEAAGTTSFYVEQDGPSMWVAVQALDTLHSLVTIAGARSDSTRPLDPAIPDPVGASGQPLPRPTSVPLPEQGQGPRPIN